MVDYEVDVSEGCPDEERRAGRGRRVRGKGPRAVDHLLRHLVGGGFTRWLVIVAATAQFVADPRPRSRPMVHRSARGSIPRVSKCIRVAFDTATESSRGDCQRREAYKTTGALRVEMGSIVEPLRGASAGLVGN